MSTAPNVRSPEVILEVRVFGCLDVRVNGAPLPSLHSRRGLWLLAILALRDGGPIDRLQLAGLLWPDSPDRTALHNLRQTLADVRRALGPAALYLQSESKHRVKLDTAHARIDVASFDSSIAEGSQPALERAVALYRGVMLEGCDEPWAVEARAARERAYLDALDRLATYCRSEQDHAGAAKWLRQAVAVDPFREACHRELMQSLADAGELTSAMEVYHHLRRSLHQTLNSEPDPETAAVFRKIRGQRGASAPTQAPQSAEATGSKTGGKMPALSRPIPVPLTELIGRHEAVREVATILSRCRLVTLTGTGGIGKTRLSVEVARGLDERFPDGICFVSLSGLTDPALVADAVREALGLQPSDARQDVVEALKAHLHARSSLIVLDNCEHLLSSCAGLVNSLLGHCPHLQVLATSRQALGLSGEALWRVPSLALPAVASDTSAQWEQDAASYAAVQLFAERARAGDPAFRMSPRRVPAVVDICRRLDGIPLAIELAASRVRTVPLEEIHARLDQGFGILASQGPDIQHRHRTLEATFNWSWELLSAEEQILLSRLSVFAGGWSLASAESVCTGQVLDILSSLVDKSLILYVPTGIDDPQSQTDTESRYYLLETIRQFAAGRLRESGEQGASRTRHRDHFLAWSEDLNQRLLTAEQAYWFRRMEVEHDNLRAALEWCRTQEDLDEEYRLVINLTRFWNARGFLREGLGHIEAAISRMKSDLHHSLRCGALVGAGWMSYVLGDNPRARRHYEQALSILDDLGEDNIADIRFNWDPGGRVTNARVLGMLACVVQSDNDYASARALFEESLALYRRLGRISPTQLNNLGYLVLEMGDLTAAREYLEESAALCASTHPDPQQQGITLGNLAIVACKEGRLGEALVQCSASLRLLRDCGLLIELALPLHYMTLIACALSEWEYAARLFGAATSLSETAQYSFSAYESRERAMAEAAIQGALGSPLSRIAMAAGEELSAEEALAFALQFASDRARCYNASDES